MTGFVSLASLSLPPTIFMQLHQLVQTMGQKLDGAIVLTHEDAVASREMSFAQTSQHHHFSVVWSERFKALVAQNSPVSNSPVSNSPIPNSPLESSPETDITSAALSTQLCFDPARIRQQLEDWLAPEQQEARAMPIWAEAELHPNDAELQAEFTAALITLLTASQSSTPLVCQPLEVALQRRLAEERLLSQVTAQIRQSLELDTILNTAIAAIRDYLGVDRVMIYQVLSLPRLRKPRTPTEIRALKPESYRVYESCPDPNLPSVTDALIYPHVLHPLLDWEQFQQGHGVAVDAVATAYAGLPRLQQAMQRLQVQSRFTVPILVQSQIWGLLTLHQCHRVRPWQQADQEVVQHLAEHLAIAIYQSQLYLALEQQKQTLEERVKDYTQELQMALLAAQAANRTKSEFLATMSHELRTPLTCVIGMSATMLRWSFGPLSDRQRNYLKTIHDSGEHLLELINDILEFSQIEAGKTILKVTEFSLQRLAQHCLQMFYERAKLAQVVLTSELRLTPAQDPFLADRRRIQQILTNLLSNAIKFTPADGQVTLRMHREGAQITIEVEDTGIGIESTQQELIFKQFHQLDASHRRQYGGAGLGLALTQQFVELHGGTIAIDSQPGRGSKFTVRLPSQTSIRPLPAQPTIDTDLTPPQGQIVLLEDDDETATLICDLLTAAGYQVIWLVEGSTAVDQIEILNPVAVIADLHLPGTSGAEIIQRLRAQEGQRSLRIVALLAADVNIDELQLTRQQEADVYLQKPLQPGKLVSALVSLTSYD